MNFLFTVTNFNRKVPAFVIYNIIYQILQRIMRNLKYLCSVVFQCNCWNTTPYWKTSYPPCPSVELRCISGPSSRSTGVVRRYSKSLGASLLPAAEDSTEFLLGPLIVCSRAMHCGLWPHGRVMHRACLETFLVLPSITHRVKKLIPIRNRRGTPETLCYDIPTPIVSPGLGFAPLNYWITARLPRVRELIRLPRFISHGDSRRGELVPFLPV